MAQILHITTPHNSGSGDPLATAMEHQNSMNTELYTDKVDKVGGKGLSDTNFSQAEKDKLEALNTLAQPQVQANWEETSPTSLAYILNKPETLGITPLPFERLLVAQQDFELPFGKIAVHAFVNGAIWYIESPETASEPNTFSREGTTLTFKTVRPIGNLIIIYIQ